MTTLKAVHTFHLNAKANKIIEITTLAEAVSAWQNAKAQNEPVLLLGQGSNVLFVISRCHS